MGAATAKFDLGESSPKGAIGALRRQGSGLTGSGRLGALAGDGLTALGRSTGSMKRLLITPLQRAVGFETSVEPSTRKTVGGFTQQVHD